MSEECPICYDDKDCLEGMCGHHICEDCYEGLSLKKKKCPLCRGDYDDLNEGWFMECVEAKGYIGKLALSWKFFKSCKGKDTVEREDEYSDWKEEHLRECVDNYVSVQMCKEGLNGFLSSYGFGKALVDYTDEYGLQGLPTGGLKVERCLVFHKIHTFLREFLL